MTLFINHGKVAPKTGAGDARHSKIQTTLDLYIQDDSEEQQAAQAALQRRLRP
jgi:hypothetical protein